MLLDYRACWCPGRGSGHVVGRSLSTVGGATTWARQAFGPAELFEDHCQAALCLREFPGQNAPPTWLSTQTKSLVVTVLEHCRNEFSWPGSLCCLLSDTRPFPHAHHGRIPAAEPTIALPLHWAGPGQALHEVTHDAGVPVVSLGLRFPTGEVRASQGSLREEAHPGDEQCCQAPSFPPSEDNGLVSVGQGPAFPSALCPGVSRGLRAAVRPSPCEAGRSAATCGAVLGPSSPWEHWRLSFE